MTREAKFKVCETIEDADGCPEYMRLHADWSRLRKQDSRIRHAAEAVCWFDWSHNDSDAVATIERLKEALK